MFAPKHFDIFPPLTGWMLYYIDISIDIRVVQRLGGRRCHKFVPVFGGDGTKLVPPGDLFYQPPGKVSSIRGKLADQVGDHVVLSPEGVVFGTSPETESSYPRPPSNR